MDVGQRGGADAAHVPERAAGGRGDLCGGESEAGPGGPWGPIAPLGDFFVFKVRVNVCRDARGFEATTRVGLKKNLKQKETPWNDREAFFVWI